MSERSPGDLLLWWGLLSSVPGETLGEVIECVCVRVCVRVWKFSTTEIHYTELVPGLLDEMSPSLMTWGQWSSVLSEEWVGHSQNDPWTAYGKGEEGRRERGMWETNSWWVASLSHFAMIRFSLAFKQGYAVTTMQVTCACMIFWTACILAWTQLFRGDCWLHHGGKIVHIVCVYRLSCFLYLIKPSPSSTHIRRGEQSYTHQSYTYSNTWFFKCPGSWRSPEFRINEVPLQYIFVLLQLVHA